MRFLNQTLYHAHQWSALMDRVNQLSGLIGDARLTDDEVYDLVVSILEDESRRIAKGDA